MYNIIRNIYGAILYFGFCIGFGWLTGTVMSLLLIPIFGTNSPSFLFCELILVAFLLWVGYGTPFYRIVCEELYVKLNRKEK